MSPDWEEWFVKIPGCLSVLMTHLTKFGLKKLPSVQPEPWICFIVVKQALGSMHWHKASLHFILFSRGKNGFGLHGCGWNPFTKYLWSDWGNDFRLNPHTAWNSVFWSIDLLFYHSVVLNPNWQNFLFKLFILMKSNNWCNSARFLGS